MKRALIILGLLALASCTTPRTQVMVLIEAEPNVRAQVADVEIRIWGGPNGTQLMERGSYTLNRPQYPIRVPVIPENNDPSRQFRVQAIARDPGANQLAVARVLSGYVGQRTLALTMWLRDSCLGVRCDGLDQTCTDAECRSAYVDPGMLPDYVDPGRSDSGMPPGPFCGDGFFDPFEQCDDGNMMDGDGCSSDCQIEQICGDGEPTGSEACDDGPQNGTYGLCNTECTAQLTCGDGIITSPEEQCDTGINPNGCDPNTCQLILTGCGDFNVDPTVGEQCDDGNQISCDGTGCSELCREEFCGNGTVECSEECDPPMSGLCSPTCANEVASVCGDGARVPGELCYDTTAPRIIEAPGGGWTRVVAADFDGDGNADLALSRQSPAEIRAYRGDGTGGLTHFITATGASGLRMIAVDADGDFRDDLVATGTFCATPCMSAHRVEFSSGSLQFISSTGLLAMPRDFAVGQLDGAAGLDIGVAYTAGAPLDGAVWRNDWPPSSRDEFDLPMTMDQIALLPAMGTTPPRVIALNFASGQITGHRYGTGGSVNAMPEWTHAFGGGSSGELLTSFVVVSGSPDMHLVAVTSGGATGMEVRTIRFDGSGAGTSSWGRSEGVAAAELGFADGDSFQDVVVGTQDGTMLVGLGDGTGLFGPSPALAVVSGCGGFTSIALADFDNDGAADVVYVPTAGSPCGPTMILSNP